MSTNKYYQRRKEPNGRIWSWGLGTDSTAGIMHDIKIGAQIDEVIFCDPGYEQDRSYEILPQYKEIFESHDIEVTILRRDYTIVEHFKDLQKVPLGWVNPYCSSHFKRDLIRPYLRNKYGTVIECIGHSADEPKRIKYPEYPLWLTREYPNYDKGLYRSDLVKLLPIDVGKSACKFCPNKSWNYFKQLDQDEPQVIDLMIEMEDNPFDATFKQESMKSKLRGDTALDDFFSMEDANCSEYCYT